MNITQKGETMSSSTLIENLVHVLEEINVSAFLDNWGPKYIIQVYNPEKVVQGLLIIDNTVLGPGNGFINLSQNMSPRDLFINARTMTWSCAVNNVNFGGAAAWIKMDPASKDKLEAMKVYAMEIAPYIPNQFIASPGMNLGQNEMKAFVEALGDRKGATGKPISMDGIPFEFGVLELGMSVSIETVLEMAGLGKNLPKGMSESRIAIQGFDTIGVKIAKYLFNKGAKIVALGDDSCTIFSDKGIDIEKTFFASSEGTPLPPLSSIKNVRKSSPESIIESDCNVLVLPTAKNIITEKNVKNIKAQCIVEGLNKPINVVADQSLCEKGVTIIPDILTVSGAPISSFAEFTRVRYDMGFSLIEKRVRETVKNLTQRAFETDIPLRRQSIEVAKEKIIRSMEDKI